MQCRPFIAVLISLLAVVLVGCSDPGEQFVTVQKTISTLALEPGEPTTYRTETKVIKVSDGRWKKKRDGDYRTYNGWTPATPEDAKKVEAFLNK